ncbi:MAG: hypothetical protein U0670_02735 [Anaerolineae bacterium]
MAERSPTSPKPHRASSPLSAMPIHQLLVLSEKLARLPTALVVLLILLLALGVGWNWNRIQPVDGMIAGGAVLVMGVVNGWMLSELPRRQRSWGAPNGVLLALMVVQSVILGLAGWMGSAVEPLAAGLLIGAILLDVLLTGIAFYATWIEPFRVGVTYETLSVTAAAHDGAPRVLRVMHLGDLHLERIGLREQRVNILIESLKPDLILFSGDFVNISYQYDPEAEQGVRTVIGAWRAPMGVLAVAGTPAVEPLGRVISFTQGLDGLRLLLNDWQSFETPVGVVHVLGLVTTHHLPLDRSALTEALTNAPETPGLRVLLTHSPDIAPEAAAAGFDLYVCGHTHGGQIRLPFIGALLTSSHYGQRFVKGKYRLEQMTLYVTRGLGMEGFGAPRARFLCPPEIVLWEIRA